VNTSLEEVFKKAEDITSEHCASTQVLLKSGGGDIEAGMRIGRIIREDGLDTDIHGHCESSCVFIFISGVRRTVHINSHMDESSKLGVHQPASELLFHRCVTDDSESGPIVQEISQYMHLMLSEESAKDLSTWMFETSCHQIAYIDGNTLLKSKIATESVTTH
jgi:hypothetical protein